MAIVLLMKQVDIMFLSLCTFCIFMLGLMVFAEDSKRACDWVEVNIRWYWHKTVTYLGKICDRIRAKYR